MQGLPTLDFDLGKLAEIDGRRIPNTVLRNSIPCRRSRMSSGQRRMSVSPGEDQAEEPMTPPSRERVRHSSCSSASSSRSPSICDSTREWPSSASSEDENVGSQRGRRRPSISEMSDSARMTPEALAVRGAGFPWRQEPALCRLDLGSGSSSGADMDEGEREHARAFCLIATPELRNDASPLQANAAPSNPEYESASNLEELQVPNALSFEEEMRQSAHDSPSRLLPPLLAQLRCPPSFQNPGRRDAPPATPSSSPPKRPAQKRLRPATAVRGGG